MKNLTLSQFTNKVTQAAQKARDLKNQYESLDIDSVLRHFKIVEPNRVSSIRHIPISVLLELNPICFEYYKNLLQYVDKNTLSEKEYFANKKRIVSQINTILLNNI